MQPATMKPLKSLSDLTETDHKIIAERAKRKFDVFQAKFNDLDDIDKPTCGKYYIEDFITQEIVNYELNNHVDSVLKHTKKETDSQVKIENQYKSNMSNEDFKKWVNQYLDEYYTKEDMDRLANKIVNELGIDALRGLVLIL